MTIDLDTVSHADLVITTERLCQDDPAFEEIFQAELEEVIAEDVEFLYEAPVKKVSGNTKRKRNGQDVTALDHCEPYKKIARVQPLICGNCGELFTSADGDETCRYHADKENIAGSLEVNDEEDFWADHDEDCHGIIDSTDSKISYPEGFKWDCCDQPGDAEVCRIGASHGDDRKTEMAQLVLMGAKFDAPNSVDNNSETESREDGSASGEDASEQSE